MTNNEKDFHLATVCEAHKADKAPSVGEHVKLTFMLNEPAERNVEGETENGLVRVAKAGTHKEVGSESMWVKVTNVNEDGEEPVYTGFIDNDPVYIKSAKYRDLVEFTQNNITGLMPTAH